MFTIKRTLYAPQVRKLVCEAVMKAEKNSVVTISPPPRTLDQNAKMWAMINDIMKADPLGMKIDDQDIMKAMIMRAMGQEVAFAIGFDGKPFPLGYSSRKMGKRLMSEMIEWMYAFGAEHGIEWSEPRDRN